MASLLWNIPQLLHIDTQMLWLLNSDYDFCRFLKLNFILSNLSFFLLFGRRIFMFAWPFRTCQSTFPLVIIIFLISDLQAEKIKEDTVIVSEQLSRIAPLLSAITLDLLQSA